MTLKSIEQTLPEHKSTGVAVRNRSLIQQAALTEKQSYIENIFYPLPFQGNKALPNEIKQIVIAPIENCIHAPVNAAKSTVETKIASSLDDWFKSKTPNLTFAEFKILASQEHARDGEIDENLLAEIYVIRTIDEVGRRVDITNAPPLDEAVQQGIQYSISPPKGDILTGNVEALLSKDSYSAEQSHRYEEITAQLQRSTKIVGQMEKYGIDKTRSFYKGIHEIDGIDSPKKLDITRTKIMEGNSLIREYELTQESANKERVFERMDELSQNTLEHLNKKRLYFNSVGAERDESRMKEDIESYGDKLSDQYKEGYAYLDSLIPSDQRRLLDKSPYYVLKLANALRKVFPVANTEVLAELWWQLRLGGARSKDIYEHLKTEWPEFVKKNNLEKYTKHLADNYLSSEAAGFEFQQHISIPEGLSPNALLFQTMKSLIQHHIPKNQEYVSFTLLEGENAIRKISIPYYDGISETEIHNNIDNAIRVSKWKSITLSEKERAQLSYSGYSSKERVANPTYQEIYGGFEGDGDYLIQMGGHHTNTRDPQSLFAVDSHRAAVQLSVQEAGKVSITTRYNHSHFDGVPAHTHTSTLLNEITLAENNPHTPTILGEGKNTIAAQIRETLQTSETTEPSSLPLCEVRADFNDEATYEAVKYNEGAGITRTEMRSLVLARANGVEHFQQLVSGKADGAYFNRNQNYNNIQPVVFAPSQLTLQNKVEWARGVRSAVKRASKDVGEVALIAAIAGTREAPLGFTGSMLNPRLTNMLSHTQGMVSALPAAETFTTAISNVHRPAKIDLNDPVPSMGVVGIALNGDKAHYTTRLLPAQAQKQFRQAVLDICDEHLSEESKRTVLNEFTKIIKAWDKLIGGTGKPITLEKYEKTRNRILQSLIDNEYIQNEKNIDTGEKLQVYLNEALQGAANDVFNKTNIEQSRKELDELLRAK